MNKLNEEQLINSAIKDISNEVFSNKKSDPVDTLFKINDLLHSIDGLNISNEQLDKLNSIRELLLRKVNTQSNSRFEAIAMDSLLNNNIIKEDNNSSFYDKILNIFKKKDKENVWNPTDSDINDIYNAPSFNIEKDDIFDILDNLSVKIEVYLPTLNTPKVYKASKDIKFISDPRVKDAVNKLKQMHPHSKIIATNGYSYLKESLNNDLKEYDVNSLYKTSNINPRNDLADIDEMLAFAKEGIHPALCYEKVELVDNIVSPVKRLIKIYGIAKNGQIIIMPGKIELDPESGKINKIYDKKNLEAISADQLLRIIDDLDNIDTLTRFYKKYPEAENLNTLEQREAFIDLLKSKKAESDNKFFKWRDENKEYYYLDKFKQDEQIEIYNEIVKKHYPEDYVIARHLLKNWRVKNKKAVQIINSFYDKIGNTPETKDLIEKFEFKLASNDLNGTELYNELLRFYEEEIKPLIGKESTLTEISKTKITDPEEIVGILKNLKINPAFMSDKTPIRTLPWYNKKKYNSPEEDPNAEPGKNFVIVGFPDANQIHNLMNNMDSYTGNELITLKDRENPRERFDITLDELQDLIKNNPENKTPNPDWFEIAQNPHIKNKPLHPGFGDKWKDIPRDAIEIMLKTMEKEHPMFKGVYETYLLNPNDPLVKKALKVYNIESDTQIRVFKNKNGYKGYSIKGSVPSKNAAKSNKGNSAHHTYNPYKDLMK